MIYCSNQGCKTSDTKVHHAPAVVMPFLVCITFCKDNTENKLSTFIPFELKSFLYAIYVFICLIRIKSNTL